MGNDTANAHSIGSSLQLVQAITCLRCSDVMTATRHASISTPPGYTNIIYKAVVLPLLRIDNYVIYSARYVQSLLTATKF